MDERSLKIIEQTKRFAANNYDSLPIVATTANQLFVFDPEGNHYLDCLSCYSAQNFGHLHWRLVEAAKSQLDKICAPSRAVYTENLGEFCEQVSKLCKFGKVLPMNTGAEAVETAIKIARKWGYVKGIPEDQANIIVCEHNFHGRTTTIVGFSSEEQYKDGFGPFTPGFKVIPFGDANALRRAIDNNTAAFLVEPIQGEGGVNVPYDGYLKDVEQICDEANVLTIVDEIQTGFGRTGYDLAYQHDDAVPDIVVLGKALGGGILAVSAVVARESVMDVIQPGDHGSTFGGNPLACAVGIEAVKLLQETKLSEKARETGEYFLGALKCLRSPIIREVRGRGLMIGIELINSEEVKKAVRRLLNENIIVGKTRNVLRINPPLTIGRDWINILLTKLEKVLCNNLS